MFTWNSLLTARAALATMTAVSFIMGCGPGDGPQLAEVSGTVRLDGEPLKDALVTFQPQGPGTYSTGLTDEQGRYRLRYSRQKMGAMIGTHEVTITTALEGGDDEFGNPGRAPEKVPPQYNRDTELTAEVTPKSNTIDFDLETNGWTPAASRPTRRSR